MKKTGGLVLIFLILFSTSFGQDTTKINEHYIGLHGAAVISTIFSEYDLDVIDDVSGMDIQFTPYLQGYSFGISYKTFMEKSAGLLVELNYVKKGGYNNFFYDTDTSTVDSKLVLFRQDLDYIEMPVLTDIRIGKKNGRIHFYGGPHIAYLIKQNVTLLESDNGKVYLTKTDKKIDFGLNVGLGYGYSFGKSTVELSIKYSHSLSNIFEQQTINKAFVSQNQVVSGMLYYYYKL